MSDPLSPPPREPSTRPLPDWAKKLVYVLDDLVPIPGLDRGVGLDAIVGFLFPGAGDAATGILSFAILVLALYRGVPGVVLTRMVMNLLVDALVGAVPGLGDLFDVFFRSNRRNLELLERYADDTHEPSAREYAIVAVGITIACGLLALPFVVGVWLIRWLMAH